LRWPEWIGIVFLSTIILAGLATFQQIAQGSWIKTTAQVIGVSLPEASDHKIPESPIAKSQSGLSVLYEYHVNNRMFKGAWKSNWLSTPMVDRVAPEFVSTLKNVDMVRVRNLPEESQGEITLETGLQNSMVSVEAPKSIRGEDFYNISTYRRKSLAGILPKDGSNPWLEKDKLPTINIRYNPKDPSESILNYPGFNFRYPAIIGFTISLMITMVYFLRWYPNLKLNGY
jgi:hypothetical protein